MNNTREWTANNSGWELRVTWVRMRSQWMRIISPFMLRSHIVQARETTRGDQSTEIIEIYPRSMQHLVFGFTDKFSFISAEIKISKCVSTYFFLPSQAFAWFMSKKNLPSLPLVFILSFFTLQKVFRKGRIAFKDSESGFHVKRIHREAKTFNYNVAISQQAEECVRNIRSER